MNEVRIDELVRLSMRRELTPEERSRLEDYLAAHPEARNGWEEERALSRAVQSLPDVPVSSNFTSRVLQALDVDEAREGRSRQATGREWLRRLMPRLAWATVAVLLSVVAFQQVQTSQQENFAKDVSFAAADLARLPNPEILLQDFDAIQELGQISTVSAGSDDELLRVLQ